MAGLGRTDGSSPMPSMLPFTERDFAPAWADTLELLPAGPMTSRCLRGVMSYIATAERVACASAAATGDH